MEERICQQCGLPLKIEKRFKARIPKRSDFATYICPSGHKESLKNHTIYEQKEKEIYEKNRTQKSHHQR